MIIDNLKKNMYFISPLSYTPIPNQTVQDDPSIIQELFLKLDEPLFDALRLKYNNAPFFSIIHQHFPTKDTIKFIFYNVNNANITPYRVYYTRIDDDHFIYKKNENDIICLSVLEKKTINDVFISERVLGFGWYFPDEPQECSILPILNVENKNKTFKTFGLLYETETKVQPFLYFIKESNNKELYWTPELIDQLRCQLNIGDLDIFI